MKILSFFLFISFAFCSCTGSDSPVNLDNETAVKKHLSEKWEAEYMETVGMRNKVPEEMRFETEYFTDGTYSSGVKKGTIKTKGNWSYDPKNHNILQSTTDGSYPSRIIKLTGKELIITQYLIMNGEIRDSTIFTYRKI